MSRILLSAYACAPERGSEPGVGWNWATDLASQGHQVHVLTRRSNRGAIEAVRTPRGLPNLHFWYCDLPGALQSWKRLPGAIYLYYLLWQWLAYRRARQLHREHGFDIVHHVTFVSLRGPSFMGRLGIPFYFGPVSGGECVPRHLRHSLGWRARAFERLRDLDNLWIKVDPLMRATFRRAQRIYLTSEESLALIPPRFREKCSVRLAVGLGRNELALTSRSPLRAGASLDCLYVGRLLEWKGLALALRALAAAKQQAAAVRLTLIGEGPAKGKLQALAGELGIEEQVAFVPWLPHPEIQQRFRRHHVFLFPSLRDSGGMAVLEALANGLPVVCTDRGGPGIMVTPHCGRMASTVGRTEAEVAAEIAEHLVTLARNRGLRESLGLNARRRAWNLEFGKLVESIHGRPPEPLPELAEAEFSWA
jgi:glycosyltransferase involved in cell wall biosynthesis